MSYYENNRDRCLRHMRDVVRPKIIARRREVLELLGGKCISCGFDDYRALQIDHIHGGGVIENKRYGSGMIFLNLVVDSIAYKENKYQLLCANCNWIKKHDRGEFSGSATAVAHPEVGRTLFDE